MMPSCLMCMAAEPEPAPVLATQTLEEKREEIRANAIIEAQEAAEVQAIVTAEKVKAPKAAVVDTQSGRPVAAPVAAKSESRCTLCADMVQL